jgi:hypothetical protein
MGDGHSRQTAEHGHRLKSQMYSRTRYTLRAPSDLLSYQVPVEAPHPVALSSEQALVPSFHAAWHAGANREDVWAVLGRDFALVLARVGAQLVLLLLTTVTGAGLSYLRHSR